MWFFLYLVVALSVLSVFLLDILVHCNLIVLSSLHYPLYNFSNIRSSPCLVRKKTATMEAHRASASNAPKITSWTGPLAATRERIYVSAGQVFNERVWFFFDLVRPISYIKVLFFWHCISLYCYESFSLSIR